MPQKTITISGKTYTPAAVDRLMQASDYQAAGGYLYHINLGGIGYYAIYRVRRDGYTYYAHRCNRQDADYIHLLRGERGCQPSGEQMWLEFRAAR